jgi:hypothetical protein
MATLTEIVKGKVDKADLPQAIRVSDSYLGYWPDLTGGVVSGEEVGYVGEFWRAVENITDVTLSEPSDSNPSWIKLQEAVFDYVTSQLAGGDPDLVGYIYIGQTVDTFDYLIYPADGRTYERVAVTGTVTGTFNPTDGTATGLTGPLAKAVVVGKLEVDLYKQSVPITMTDATYTLDATEQLYGRINISGTLTAEQELVVGTEERFLTVKNNTDYAVKVVCTASGNGVHVPPDEYFSLRIESGDVLTEGSENHAKVDVFGASTSGTVTYPHGLTQDKLERLVLFGNRATVPDEIRTTDEVPKYFLDDVTLTWSLNLSKGAVVIVCTSNGTNGFTLSGSSSNGSYAGSVYYLKDGVTY